MSAKITHTTHHITPWYKKKPGSSHFSWLIYKRTLSDKVSLTWFWDTFFFFFFSKVSFQVCWHTGTTYTQQNDWEILKRRMWLRKETQCQLYGNISDAERMMSTKNYTRQHNWLVWPLKSDALPYKITTIIPEWLFLAKWCYSRNLAKIPVFFYITMCSAEK